MAWYDDVKLRLYISESGDFVSLGERTVIPINSGGSGGVPAGWSMYQPQGGYPNINFTTQGGRFSISNGNAADAGLYKQYGAWVAIPVVAGKRYILNVQAQVMEGKSTANRVVNQATTSNGSSWGINNPAVSPWEDIALYGNFESQPGDMRLFLTASNYQASDNFNWGVQFQNLSVIALDSTYPNPVWHEVTCDIRSVQLREGRERMTNRYEVGQASIGVLNDNGEFTYQPAHPWGLRPGRFIKVEATYNNVTYPVYYGLIDGMSNDYTIDGHALTTMNCVDVSSLLANQTIPSMSDPDTLVPSGIRLQQILNGIAWHPSRLNTTNGVFLQQGIVANGRTVRDELGLIADSEGSYFFADRSGDLFYRGRDWADTRIKYVQAELLAEMEGEPTIIPGTHLVFPGVLGNYLTIPHSQALNLPNGGEVVARVAFNNRGQSSSAIINKRISVVGGVDDSWTMQQIGTTDWFGFNVGRYGTSFGPLAFPANKPMWLKGTINRTTKVIALYYSFEDTETEPTVWTLGSSYTIPVLDASTVGTADIHIGERPSNLQPMMGRVYRTIVRDANATLLDMSSDDAYGKDGQLSFVATSGQTVTVNQVPPHKVIQDDTWVYSLPVVDDIPTVNNAPIVCTNKLESTWSRDRVINELSLANQRGSAITVIDSESQKAYGPKTYSRMDFLNDNAHPEYLLTRADDLMEGNTDASIRINAISFNPALNDLAGWKWTLSVFMNDLVRVRYTHPTEGWGFSAVAHVQGIEHTITTTKWQCRIALDDYETFTYWVESDTITGWDLGNWDEDIWDGAGSSNTAAFWNAKYAWSAENSKWG